MSIIEIRPGNGGTDAEDFAGELTNSFVSSLKSLGYQCQLEAMSEVSRSFIIKTDAPLQSLQWLKGTHVVTRIPKGSSARHTSSASVLVRDKVQTQKVVIKDEDIRVDRIRGHGAGGQKRNKTESSIRLLHKPSGIIITRMSGRSQTANLEDAMRDLENRLANLNIEKAHKDLTQARTLEDESRIFTHNYQRGEVIHHASGKRWNIKKWYNGKVSIMN